MSDPDPPVTRSDEADEVDETGDVSLDKVLRNLARDFLKDFLELLFPGVVPVLDLSTAEFVGDELFATFRKKGHVRPDVVVKLGTRDGE
ncbi:MAG: hypothetical protein GY856_19245, partial [bacterium]|nr:hypothetical protein [bacterium]